MYKFKKSSELLGLSKRAEFMRKSYRGGYEYREGDHLIKYERETSEDFKRRKEITPYRNLCGDIIDSYISYLYREPPTRNVSFIEKYQDDIDNQNSNVNDVFKRIARKSSIEGFVAVIVDKPNLNVKTKADELSLGVHPYIAEYGIEDVISVQYVKENGRKTLDSIILQEETEGESKLYKEWDRMNWFLYEQKDKNEPELIEGGVHNLGQVPIVFFVNKKESDILSGQSDLKDIADLNNTIYNTESGITEINRRTAFPIFQTPQRISPPNGQGASANGGDVILGTGNALEFDPDNPDTKSSWLEPDNKSSLALRDYIQDIKDTIDGLSKLGKAEGNKVESGIAIELRFQLLNALLSDKAAYMEQGETRVYSLMALWDNTIQDIEVSYPKSFGIRDIKSDIDNAISANLFIQSKTFKKELSIEMASRLLKEASPEVLKTIEDELTVKEPLNGL